MRAVRPLVSLIVAGASVLAAAIILCAAVDDSSQWSVQTSGIDTNLRGVSAGRLGDTPGSARTAIWASGSNGVILQSIDLGKTWKRLSVAGGESLDFRSIQAKDERTAYVMSSGEGDKSRIYKTTDGGAHWKLQYAGKRKEFFLDALVCADDACYALSDPVDGKFVILRTTDGENWSELPAQNMPAALHDEGAFAASGTCLAVRQKEIYFVTGGPRARVFHSSDGGRRWSVAEAPIASGNASSGIFSIALRERLAVIVGGDYKNANQADRVAANSEDGGGSWKLAQQQPGGYRSAVAWTRDKTLVAAGPSGEDVSYDEGAHWANAGSLNLNALAAFDSTHVWAVGPNGTVAVMRNRQAP
jgi:photosystem II stability/assembly factor-like uncharacterized protein